MSNDGRFVAFASQASNLVAGDSNGEVDIFVHDRQLAVTERVSVATGGGQANSNSHVFAMSADGRFVAFTSNASNLVAGDSNGRPDIFVRDRQLGTTERVSVATGGAEGDDNSDYQSISDDGRFVAFWSDASNLVAGDTNGLGDVFVRDRQLATTERASVSSGGAQASAIMGFFAISSDGRYVAFSSDDTSLFPGDANGSSDAFVRDLLSGTTELVSVDTTEEQGDGNSLARSISLDGRWVGVVSDATNLVVGDANGQRDFFVRDRVLGATERVSLGSGGAEGNGISDGATISPDGRFVAFWSDASNLVAGDTNGKRDSFIRDRQLGTTERVSVATSGAQGNGDCWDPRTTPDGRFVAFYGHASNLVAGDTNTVSDVFLRDRNPAAFQTTWTGAATALWSNPANWTNGVPNSGIDAIIPPAANSPTTEASPGAACRSLTVQSGGVLTIGAPTPFALAASGSVFVDTGGSIAGGGILRFVGTGHFAPDGSVTATLEIATSGTVAVTAGSFNLPVSGSLTLSSGTLTFGSDLPTLRITGDATLSGGTLGGNGLGQLWANGNVTFSGTTVTSPPDIRVQGNWSANASFAPTSNAVILFGFAGTQTISGTGLRFHDLYVGHTTTTTASLTIGNDLVVGVGGTESFTTTSTLEVGSLFSVSANATAHLGAATHTLHHRMSVFGGTVTGTGLLVFDASIANYGSLEMGGNSSVLNVQVDAGTETMFFTGTPVITGTLTLTSGQTQINVSNLVTVQGSAFFDGGSLRGLGTLDLNGDAFFAGTTTAFTTPLIRCAGSWTADAAFVPAASTVIFDGTSPQTISGTGPKFFDLTIAAGAQVGSAATVQTFDGMLVTGSFATAGTLDIGGDFVVDPGGTANLGSGTHTFHKSVTANGALVGSGTMVGAGTGDVSSPGGSPLPSFTVASAGTVTFSGSTLNVSGSLNLDSGTLEIDAGNTTAVAGLATFSGGSLAGAGTLDLIDVVFTNATALDPPLIRCAGDWTASSQFHPLSGLVEFDGSALQVVDGRFFHDLAIEAGADVACAQTIMTIQGDLTVAGQLTHQVTSAFLGVIGDVTIDPGGTANFTTLRPGQDVNVNGTIGFAPGGQFLVEGLVPQTITVTVPTTFAGLSAGSPGPVTLAGSAPVTVGGLSCGVGTFVVASGTTVNLGPISIGGTLVNQTGGAPGGEVVAGNVNFPGSGAYSALPGSILRVRNDFYAEAGFAPAAGIVIFDGTTETQDVDGLAGGVTFHEWRIAAGTTASAHVPVHTLDAFTVGGSFQTTSSLEIGGDFEIEPGGTANLGSGTSTFHKSVTANGQLLGSGAMVIDGSGDVSSPGGSSLPSVQIATSGTVNFTGATLNIAGFLELVAGTLQIDAGNTTTVSGAVGMNGGTLIGVVGLLPTTGTLDANANVTFAGTSSSAPPLIRCAGNWTANAQFAPTSNAVVFDGTAAQTIAGASFFDVTVAPGANAQISIPLDVAGALTVNGGLSGTTPIDVTGDLVVADALSTTSTLSVSGNLTVSGSVTAGTSVDVEGDVTLTGTPTVATPLFRCAGSWTASPGFAPSSGTVELDGAGTSAISAATSGGTLNFNALAVKNGTRQAGNDFTLATSQVTVQSTGTLDLLGRQVARPAGATSVDGTLAIGIGGELALGPTASVSVGSSGTLRVAGSPGSPARVVGTGGGGYSLAVHGTLRARSFLFQGMGPNGIVIAQTAAIGPPPFDLRGGTFDFGSASAGSTLLDLQRSAPADFRYVTFLNTSGAVTHNVRCLAGAPISFTNWSGAWGGAAHEDDPGSLVAWNPDQHTQLTSFTAAGRAGYVSLHWQTATETDVDRFVLERATSAGGPYATVVEVAPGQSSYAYSDSPLTAGQPCFYRLQERLTHDSMNLLGSASATPGPVGVIYVKADATGAGTGSTWTDAFTGLQDGLLAAGSGAQVWVAAAVHEPAGPGRGRAETFQLENGVAVYGGFAGTETLLSQRDPVLNVTVLSGDLNGDDQPGFVNDAENSYHVVTGSGSDATAVLDGFTITAGNANGSGADQDGAGMLVAAGSPTIRQCVFAANRALASGGGMHVSAAGAPRIERTIFAGNAAASGGGACSASSSPVFVACRFEGNSAVSGAGCAATGGGSPQIASTAFRANAASGDGGGIHCAGAGLGIANGLFTGNTAARGGAAFSGPASGLALRDSSAAANTATGVGGGVCVDASDPVIADCVLWGNADAGGTDESAQVHVITRTPSVTYCCVQGLTGALGGVGNVGTDPLLLDPDGVDGAIGTQDDDLRLRAGSSAIDSGRNSDVAADAADLDLDANTGEPLPQDALGHARFQDDPAVADTGSGSPPIVDMGAIEREIDCNGNSVPDIQDLSLATSQDCNGNGVPDECDIDDGFSLDQDGNGVPDDCPPGPLSCFPGQAGVIGCPCTNPPGAADVGCNNSASTGGAHLTATGAASLSQGVDTVVLRASQMLPTALAIYLQGSAPVSAGATFGDGIRCTGGSLKRLGVKASSGGASQYPGAGDLSVSAKSAALGETLSPGFVRYYQTYYRDPAPTFACDGASTFNVSNGMIVTW